MQSPLLNRMLMVVGDGMRVIKFLLSFVACIIVFVTVAFLGVYFFFARDLPDIKTLEDYRPPVISEVFADDGTKIAEFWTECRIFIPYEKIPRKVVEAFVDAEDSRFFEHKGVDMRSIARAFVANLQAGEIKQGGSTITQQITRSLLLSRERKVSRKVKEAILATRLERYLDKETILTLYLNQIYLGNRAYGVVAAARNYFKKPLSELTLGQTALLAGMPTAPTNFSPINNPAEARARQQHVLGRMVEEGHITEEEAARAAEEKFEIYIAGTDKEFDDPDAAYFSEHVRRLVKEKYGDEFLYHRGLKIYTTVNVKMQRDAARAVRLGLESLDRRKGWRGPLEHVPESQVAAKAREIAREIESQDTVIRWPARNLAEARVAKIKPGSSYSAVVTGFSGQDALIQAGETQGAIPHSGYMWARPYSKFSFGADNYNYVSDPHRIFKVGDVVTVRLKDDGAFELYQEPELQSALVAMDPRTGYIKAMMGGYDFARSEFNRATQALRQPGSSFKPFAYSAALDKGYTYNTTIVDEPVAYKVGRTDVWSPKNYGGKFNGPTPFMNAIKFSRNIPTVKIVYDIGTHYLAAYQRKMGITTQIDKYLSMALGANAVYLLEMVQAYSMFDNGGERIRAVAITRIEDNKGNVIESIHAPKTEIAETDAPLASSENDRRAFAADRPKIDPGELNAELFEEAERTTERDGLSLTDLEIKTLYGSEIPKGHVITPQTAYLMTRLLKGVVDGGTGTRILALGKPAAGKTGTTNDETDAWFIGFVPDLSAGVWVGYDEIRKIAPGATGGSIAAPIFLEFMKNATEGWAAKEFKPPENFPGGDIATLAGGSALFGSRPGIEEMMMRGGSDRAGEFFEEDFEQYGGDSETGGHGDL
ncbi:MAG: PBP1A family penicillin-binding protein [Proteobacteria bacterium]|nr:PBP1A family penicillin-binding protein [Pseudomonadota bacterium]